MRCFSSPRSLGYSGVSARLTARPDLSQSSTPFRLLVPRHPPHALTSLAAPPRPPTPLSWHRWPSVHVKTSHHPRPPLGDDSFSSTLRLVSSECRSRTAPGVASPKASTRTHLAPDDATSCPPNCQRTPRLRINPALDAEPRRKPFRGSQLQLSRE